MKKYQWIIHAPEGKHEVGSFEKAIAELSPIGSALHKAGGDFFIPSLTHRRFLNRHNNFIRYSGGYAIERICLTMRAADGATCPRCQGALNNDGYCLACGYPFPPRA